MINLIKLVQNQMNAKNILVSFATILAVLFLVSTVAGAEITNDAKVYIRNVEVSGTDVVGVVEGETIPIMVVFNSILDASDVKIKAEINGYDVDVEDITARFDIEAGKKYTKTLSLTIPYNLEDEASEDATLELKIYNKEHSTKLSLVNLGVQRQSYKADVMSVSTSQTAEAGQLFAVDVVLKNTGYNDLDDLYVTVSIDDLNVKKTTYFGDLVAFESDDDDEDETDTVSGRIYLEIPETAKTGVYVLKIEISNKDLLETKVKQIVIENEFSDSNIFASVTGKTVNAGEEAEYSVLIVNPTNKLKVYKLVTENADGLSVNLGETLVAVSAGTSKTVKVTAKADKEGTYKFKVNVFSGEKLLNSVELGLDTKGKSVSNPTMVLTVVLAIVFIVLLIVLFVLVGKKPEKSEEFGESYY